eukprot:13136-Eustigmatos_ZCMA.PRE.1
MKASRDGIGRECQRARARWPAAETGGRWTCCGVHRQVTDTRTAMCASSACAISPSASTQR